MEQEEQEQLEQYQQEPPTILSLTVNQIRNPKKGAHKKNEKTFSVKGQNLFRIPSRIERSKIYINTCKIISNKECLALPWHGGRGWTCHVVITDSNGVSSSSLSDKSSSDNKNIKSIDKTKKTSKKTTKQSSPPFFIYHEGQYELAILPHLYKNIQLIDGGHASLMKHNGTRGINGINDWYSKSELNEMFLDKQNEFQGCCGGDDCDEGGGSSSNHKDGKKQQRQPQQRCISPLSTYAYQNNTNPILRIERKWISPNHIPYKSRNKMLENVTHLLENDSIIDRILHGYGKNGTILKPIKSSKKVILEAGALRFIRDGLWVIGQEECWFHGRNEILEERKMLNVGLKCMDVKNAYEDEKERDNCKNVSLLKSKYSKSSSDGIKQSLMAAAVMKQQQLLSSPQRNPITNNDITTSKDNNGIIMRITRGSSPTNVKYRLGVELYVLSTINLNINKYNLGQKIKCYSLTYNQWNRRGKLNWLVQLSESTMSDTDNNNNDTTTSNDNDNDNNNNNNNKRKVVATTNPTTTNNTLQKKIRKVNKNGIGTKCDNITSAIVDFPFENMEQIGGNIKDIIVTDTLSTTSLTDDMIHRDASTTTTATTAMSDKDDEGKDDDNDEDNNEHYDFGIELFVLDKLNAFNFDTYKENWKGKSTTTATTKERKEYDKNERIFIHSKMNEFRLEFKQFKMKERKKWMKQVRVHKISYAKLLYKFFKELEMSLQLPATGTTSSKNKNWKKKNCIREMKQDSGIDFNLKMYAKLLCTSPLLPSSPSSKKEKVAVKPDSYAKAIPKVNKSHDGGSGNETISEEIPLSFSKATGRRRRCSKSRNITTSHHWRLSKKQIDICYDAIMEVILNFFPEKKEILYNVLLNMIFLKTTKSKHKFFFLI